MTVLLASLVVALLGAGWVVYPLLFRRWGQLNDAVSASVVDADARRRAALTALREADYDRAAGKLDDDDYLALKDQLEVEAMAALRVSDSIRSPAAASGRPSPHACGFRNPAGSRFCAGCGQRLG